MQKYKVFFNEKRITITSPGMITLSNPIFKFNKACTPDDIIKWLESFILNHERDVILTHPEPKTFFKLFHSVFIRINAAGGVVLRDNKLLIIFRNDKWDLPKGKIDKGETARHAAIREVEEECGITGHKIVKELPPTYHIYQSTYKDSMGQWIFKTTHWYEMEYNGEQPGVPETKEGITEVRWFEKNDLSEVEANTFENLKEIINLYRD
ncbi:MAG: NUDIX hydrolase [Bacteroidota bacterium]